MKRITVLFDFTETARIAIRQAMAIAIKHDAHLDMLYISARMGEADRAILKADAHNYALDVEGSGRSFDLHFREGDFFDEVLNFVQEMKSYLVVVGTHGKKGLKQHLFGSTIYKLVQKIPVPTLVVNDHSKVHDGGFKKILFPIAPHADFEVKIRSTAELVAADGKVLIFCIEKEGAELDGHTKANVALAKEIFKDTGVTFEEITVPAEAFSVGFSKQTLKYAHQNNIDLISIMAKVSNENSHFGKMDKENVLLDEHGIATLCSNS